jgi:aryl-alcohol dehydrogenase-like predicted oxidoreductase
MRVGGGGLLGSPPPDAGTGGSRPRVKGRLGLPRRYRARDHACRVRAWAIGAGAWGVGWGPQEDEESVAAIERGLELGISWIDTAAAYGFGHSEDVVGRALAGVADRPGAVAIAWTLRNPTADGAIVGFRRPDHERFPSQAASLEGAAERRVRGRATDRCAAADRQKSTHLGPRQPPGVILAA